MIKAKNSLYQNQDIVDPPATATASNARRAGNTFFNFIIENPPFCKLTEASLKSVKIYSARDRAMNFGLYFNFKNYSFGLFCL